MAANLFRYVGKIVCVSIPSLFEDGIARPYTLLGAEINGLWLQSDELTDRLLRNEGCDLARMNPAVFVPFAQIAGVLIPTSLPAPAADEPTTNALSPGEATQTKTKSRREKNADL